MTHLFRQLFVIIASVSYFLKVFIHFYSQSGPSSYTVNKSFAWSNYFEKQFYTYHQRLKTYHMVLQQDLNHIIVSFEECRNDQSLRRIVCLFVFRAFRWNYYSWKPLQTDTDRLRASLEKTSFNYSISKRLGSESAHLHSEIGSLNHLNFVKVSDCYSNCFDTNTYSGPLDMKSHFILSLLGFDS